MVASRKRPARSALSARSALKVLEMILGVVMFAGLGLLLWLCAFGIVL